MAKNECYSSGGGCNITLNEADAAYFGAALDSGEAAEWSEFTGVALIDFTADTDGVMTRCTGFEFTVTGQDDGGAQAVAVGDPLYYHDTTGVIDKAVNGGQFLGWALDTATAQEEKDMCILLEQDPDYTRFMDEQLLEFGDGAAGKGGAGDVQIWFDLADQDFMVHNATAASDIRVDATDDGRISLQSHTYGATIPNYLGLVLIAPEFGTPNPALDIMTLNVQPVVNDTVTGTNCIGFMSDVYFLGGTGDWSGVIRAGQFQFTDDASAGRTITGPVMMIRTWAQTIATITNGMYALYSEQATGATAFSYWLHVDDDGGSQADLANAIGNVNAVIHVEIGATEGYIAVYDGYTPS